jgi:putative hydrolase of the HAD superfamily
VAEITVMFWDVGGVILSNGWDRFARKRAVEKFGLDEDDFQDRHELLSNEFETGRLTLEEYLDLAVFCRPRSFSREEFRAFMLEQSKPQPEVLAIVRGLERSKQRLLATLNNESLELNLHRIEKFGLREVFDAFFSSCFLGVRKPERGIYRLATQISQQPPAQCLFIDDRELNLTCAAMLGMQTLHYRNPGQLRHELERRGIEIAPAK